MIISTALFATFTIFTTFTALQESSPSSISPSWWVFVLGVIGAGGLGGFLREVWGKRTIDATVKKIDTESANNRENLYDQQLDRTLKILEETERLAHREQGLAIREIAVRAADWLARLRVCAKGANNGDCFLQIIEEMGSWIAKVQGESPEGQGESPGKH